MKMPEFTLKIDHFRDFGIKTPEIAFDIILKTVCGFYSIEPYVVMGRSRKRIMVRHVLRYFMYQYKIGTQQTIGLMTSNDKSKPYDHATVRHSIENVVPDELTTNITFRAEMIDLKNLIDRNLINKKKEEGQIIKITGSPGYKYSGRKQRTNGNVLELILTFVKDGNK